MNILEIYERFNKLREEIYKNPKVIKWMDESIRKNNLINMTALSVNINKFALVRNARGANIPN